MLVGSKIRIMSVHFRICGFEIAKCTARTAQHDSLRLTRDSTKPTVVRDRPVTDGAFRLRGIISLQLAALLFFERVLADSAQAERFAMA